MQVETTYQFLESRPGSNYRQLFVKGRRIRAEILYHATVNAEPRTPEDVARDYHVPLDAVRESIEYCLSHPDLLRREREADWDELRERTLASAPNSS